MRKPLTETHPELVKEWHYKKNAPIKPNQVSYGMEKKVWWKCKKKGHEWQARLNHRSSRGQGCPYCAGKKIGKDNNLQILYPKLVKEWHPIKNKTFLPNQISPGSDKKYWWKCLKGHEWQTSPNNRTNPSNLNSCPFCTKQTSRPEARIFAELVSLFTDTFRRKKVINSELDIFISNYKIGIEYDGYYYHKNKETKDKEKNTKLAKHNIKIVRIRQHPLKKISTSDIIDKDRTFKKTTINKILQSISSHLQAKDKKKAKIYLNKKNFQADDVYQKILSEINSSGYGNSFLKRFPKVVKEWHPKKNHPLLPKHFSASSSEKIWWQCKKKHEWKASIDNRTKIDKRKVKQTGTGCPFCSNQKIGKDNNLGVLKPLISKEWHPNKNKKLTPHDFATASNKVVWWMCKKKGHEWQAQINSRSGRGTGCPYCAGQKTDKDNNLASLKPLLAKEWHTTKNTPLTIYDVTPNSKFKVWWQCKKKHEWQSFIQNRTRGFGKCPICRKK